MRFFRVASLMIAAVLILGAFGSPDQTADRRQLGTEPLEQASATLAAEYGIRVPDGMLLVDVNEDPVQVTSRDGVTLMEVEGKTATFVVVDSKAMPGEPSIEAACSFTYTKTFPYLDSHTGLDWATATTRGEYSGDCDPGTYQDWDTKLKELQAWWVVRHSDEALARPGDPDHTYTFDLCREDSNLEDWRHWDSIYNSNWQKSLYCDG